MIFNISRALDIILIILCFQYTLWAWHRLCSASSTVYLHGIGCVLFPVHCIDMVLGVV